MLATFSQKDLEAEVEAIINASDNAEISNDWLATEVMSRHSDVHGEDSDFYLLCAWAHVKTSVRNVVRSYRLEDHHDIESQRVLPIMDGFERLQVRYHIEREGESRLVRIEDITQVEMRAKIKGYERLDDGLRMHIAELRRYYFQRWNEHA